MEIKINFKAQPVDKNTEVDYKPLIDMFELLLEWDIKDVREKEEKGKEVS
mgnify:CR=1 FL=1